MLKNLIFVFSLCSLQTAAFADYVCRVTDTDLSSSLESAGVDPTCPASGASWACYCNLTETCRDSSSGETQVFRRKFLLGCGTLGDCMYFSSYGTQCRSYED